MGASPEQDFERRLLALGQARATVISLLLLTMLVQNVAVARRGSLFSRESARSNAVLFGFLLICSESARAATRRCRRQERPLPLRIRWLDLQYEVIMPVFAMMTWSAMEPFRALLPRAAPVYLFFIALSTLRLSDTWCLFVGAMCAWEYLAPVAHHAARHGAPLPPVAVTYIVTGIFLFAASIAAALLATRLRNELRGTTAR